MTADVAIQNLVLTEQDVQPFDSAYHIHPPLRTEVDRKALIKAVNDGTIDAIVSQHAPHELAAKQAPFAETAPGMSSLETLLSLGLQLVADKELDFSSFIKSVTSNPARIAGLENYELQEGKLADFTVLDMNSSWQVSNETMISNGKNTPFLGRHLPGIVRYTFVNGRCVFQGA